MPPPRGRVRGSRKSKSPRKGGPRGRGLTRTQEFRKSDAGKAATERGLRRALAGEGKSDVSKYDDKLAAAIRGVDFRNSPIGRSDELLQESFRSGDLTAKEFRELQNLSKDPNQSLESRRQLNIALGKNPTTGMGILDSLRSGVQGEQFQQDKRRLGQLLSLSPLRQGIVNLLGGQMDTPQTTAQQQGISAAEDARLRVLSNPEIVTRLLPEIEDAPAPEQSLLDITPVRRPPQRRESFAVSDTFSDLTGLPDNFVGMDIADPGMSNIVFGPDGRRYFGTMNRDTGQMEYKEGADPVSMGPAPEPFVAGNVGQTAANTPFGMSFKDMLMGIPSLFKQDPNFTIGSNLR